MKFRKNPFVISIIAIIIGTYFYFATNKPLDHNPVGIRDKVISLIQKIDLDTIDLRFRIRGPIHANSDIVLVVIDEKSLEKEGKWVWPRRKMAELVTKLSEAGAEVIGFDILFSEPDKNDEWMIKTIEKIREKIGHNIEKEINDYLEKVKDEASNDISLAKAIKECRAKTVLGYFFHFGTDDLSYISDKDKKEQIKNVQSSRYITMYPSDTDLKDEPVSGIYEAALPESNIKIISLASDYSGYFNIVPDIDGAVRSLPIAVKIGETFYTPMDIMIVKAHMKIEGAPIIKLIKEFDLEPESIRIGPMYFPLENGRLIINYRGGEHTYRHISITDILSGNIEKDALKNKIVIIGATAIGLYDMRVTPYSNTFPGLEVHANIIDNFIAKDFLRKTSWMTDVLAMTAFAFILGVVLPGLGILPGSILSAIMFAGYVVFSQYLFEKHGIIINVIFPVFMIIIMYLIITTYRFMVESRQKRFIKNAFSHYLAPSVIKEIIESPENLELGGKECYITAFFSDIQGFTTISEQFHPKEVGAILNEYLTEMTDIILNHQGTLDKFEGDAIIAFFGAPNKIENHAKVACTASLKMQKRLVSLRKKWKQEGKPELITRIGMCTGMAIVGNMGSKTRFDYTMIGDTVNTAARLEGLNKHYKANILINETTKNDAGDDIIVRELDIVTVVGRKKPIKIFQVMDFPENITPYMKDTINYYQEGLELYRNRKWDEAICAFEKALLKTPGDGPSMTFIDRCRRYKEDPPPAEWKAIFFPREK